MVLKILLGPLSGHHAELHLLVEVCDVNARFDEVPLTDETSWSRRGSLAWGVGGIGFTGIGSGIGMGIYRA